MTVITKPQRYFTPEEYAAMGYILIDDVTFDSGSYSSFGIDWNPLDIAYRADSPEEFAIDAAILMFKLGAGFATGGLATGTMSGAVTGMARAGWTTVAKMVLIDD